MEFQYAATGNTHALRAWLQQHPERINIPSPGTQYTLLYTSVKSKQLLIAQMLIYEFHADPNIPCGGIHNTCLHAAASEGDVDMLSFLLSLGLEIKTNIFLETPIDIARKPGGNRRGKEECLVMLRAYEQQQIDNNNNKQILIDNNNNNNNNNNKQEGNSKSWQLPTRTPPPVAMLREVIREVKIDSDDDEDNTSNNNTNNNIGRRQNTQTSLSTPISSTSVSNSAGMSTRRTMTNENDLRRNSKNPGNNNYINSSSSNNNNNNNNNNTNSVLPRNERSITGQSTLPLDLFAFRRMYGNGFTFTETSYGYQVKGLLPYDFRGNVYYTPVILILDKPIDNIIQTQQQQQQSNNNNNIFRYRALIDRKKLGNLFINRRATYIDPCTGVIIPSEVDIYYKSLLEFVQNAIISNFEILPPLTPGADEKKSVQENTPIFTLFTLQTSECELRLRILRELSIFCDEAFIYDNKKRTVTGFLPIFADYFKILLESGNNNNNNNNNNTVVATDVILKLPLRLQFSINDNFEEPPRIYLINATTKTSETRKNYNFLSNIIIDSSSGEVHRSAIPSLENWRQHGSLLPILRELQKSATLLLIEHCKKFPSNNNNNNNVGNYKITSTTNTSLYGNTNSNTRATSNSSNEILRGQSSNNVTECEDDTDWLLVGRLSSNSNNNNNNNNNNNRGISTKCVICLEAEKNFLLLPCRHLVLCKDCSQRYKDRLRDGMLCPICRTSISEMLEVYV